MQREPGMSVARGSDKIQSNVEDTRVIGRVGHLKRAYYSSGKEHTLRQKPSTVVHKSLAWTLRTITSGRSLVGSSSSLYKVLR